MKIIFKKLGLFLVIFIVISAAIVFGLENKAIYLQDKNTTQSIIAEHRSEEEIVATIKQETYLAKSNTKNTVNNISTNTAKTTEKNITQNMSDQKSVLVIELKPGNSWPNGGKTCTQIDAVLKNTSQTDVNNWNVSIDVPADAKILQGWNGKYNISGKTLKVTPETYNVTIPAGENITFGFIIETNQAFKASHVAINDKEVPQSVATNANESKLENSKQAKSETKTEAAIDFSALPPAASTGDWLYVKGNKIVDKNGKEVWITGVNWFGYNTGTNTFDGLWAANLESSIEEIANRGFNLLRIPISTELIYMWSKGQYPAANYNQAMNPNLTSKNSLEIFDYVVALCRKNGIKIMIDIHSAKTDAMGHMHPVWYNGEITEQIYLDSLAWMAKRYKNDDTIIAYDLKNEPHGKANESPRAIWNNSKDPNNWKYIAEKAAFKVLENNPNVLIVVEGIEIYPKDIKKNGNYASKNPADYYTNWWGGNLRGVKDYPINLGKYQNKLVYSPHDYGPTVYQQPWFKAGYNFDSLYRDCWKDNWMYIYETKTAPLLIGEWGGFMKEPNLTWMKHLRTLIAKNKLHHTFWCFNANSGDTGGLVYDDFKTWDEEKYNFVKQVLWTYNGKFVSLDQEIPLGKNGISLSQVK